MDSSYKQFPRSFRKEFPDSLTSKFISKYVKQQSVLTEYNKSVRSSVIPAKSDETLRLVRTLSDVLQHGAERSRYLPCIGTRRSTNDPYSWLTYFEVDLMVSSFGSGLVTLIGHNPDAHTCVGILGKNSLEWVVAMFACGTYNYVYCPLYATLGKDAMQHILTQTEMEVVVCQTCEEAEHLIRDFSSSLKYVIICSQHESGDKLKTELESSVRIAYFEEVLTVGQRTPQPIPAIDPDNLCSLCYTSGSTGLPKGVMITHKDFVAGLKRVSDFLEGKFFVPNVRHISYLPLAHIFEQINIALVLFAGGRAGIATNAPDSLLTDMAAIKPTLLPSVPRVLTRIRGEFYKKFPKSTGLQKRLQHLIDKKNAEQAKGIYDHKSFLDRLFFKKFRKALGGRVSLLISSSAPLDPDVMRFFRAALGCPVSQVYGMTELTGGATGMLIGDCSLSGGGALMPHYLVKLGDVPEMGLVAAQDNVGEICFHGLGCTSGYYRDIENTNKLFDEDGWLRTGDIGRWNEKGALEIVDRCKSMFKLTQGEYVAPEKVEAIYALCSFVRIVLLEGCSNYPFSVVIVWPDFPELRKAVIQNGSKQSHADLSRVSESSSDEELCRNIHVRRFVLDKLNSLGRERKLKGFELAKNILLTTETFSPENGLLTPTLKLARFKARAYFQEDIQKLYTEGELPPSPGM